MSSYLELLKLNLSELDDYNPEYEKLISKYDQKINVTSKYVEKVEFIKQEIERVKNLFIQPIKISVAGDFKITGGINYTEYIKIAYDSLTTGNDFKVSDIVSGAKKQYLQTKPPKVIFKEAEFIESIIKHLQLGVALLQYEKFLKIELAKPKADRDNEKNKRKNKRFWIQFWKIIGYMALIVGIIAGIDQIFNKKNDKLKIHPIPQNSTSPRYAGPFKTGILISHFNGNVDDPFSGPLSYELNMRFDDSIIIESLKAFYRHGTVFREDALQKIFEQNKSDKGLLVYGSIYYDTALFCNIRIFKLPLRINISSNTAGSVSNILIADSTNNMEVYKRAPHLADFIEALFYQCQGDFNYSVSVLKKIGPDEFNKLSKSFKSELLSLAGNNSMAFGKYENAIAIYREALELGANRNEIKFNLGLAYLLNEEYISAKNVLTEIKDKFEEVASLLGQIENALRDSEAKGYGIILKDGKYGVRFRNESETDFTADKIIEYIWKGRRYYIFHENSIYKIWYYSSTGPKGTYPFESINKAKECIQNNCLNK